MHRSSHHLSRPETRRGARRTSRAATALVAALAVGALTFGGVIPAVAVESTPSPTPTPTETVETPTPAPTETDAAADEGAAGADIDSAKAGLDAAEQRFTTIAPESISALATSGSSDIVINARVIRKESTPSADLNNSSYLQGLTYRLYPVQGSGSGSSPYGPDMNHPTDYFCVIGAPPATSCTITVPNTGSTGNKDNRDKTFFVVQETNSSTYNTPTYMVGSYSGPTTQFNYAGRTGSQLQGGKTYQFPATSQGQSGSSTRSGVLAASLNNPTIDLSCVEPLRLAIQMDLSASVSDQQRGIYRTSLQNLVDDLAGTGAEIALFTFGSTSPVSGREMAAPLNVDTQATKLKNTIASFTASPGTQRTNWDMGLRRVAEANATQNYDLVLFLTDGAPNYIANANSTNGTGPDGDNVAVKSVEQAIFSANAIKAADTRVVAVGIGNGATGNVYRNLAAVSGMSPNSDFFQGGWEQLESYIKNIVNQAICRVPVKVTKQVPSGNDWMTADDWTMTLGTPSVSVGTASIIGSNPQNTGSGANPDGESNWVVSFTDKNATATLSLAETMKAGWAFESGTYTVHHQNGTVTDGTVAGIDQTIPGVRVDDRVEVTFRNKPRVTSLTLVKDVAFGAADATSWTLKANGPQGALAGPNGKTGSAAATAEVTPDVAYSLNETGGSDTYVQVGEWVCLDQDALPVAVTAAAVSVPVGKLVTCTVTNATSSLTLLKHVVDPALDPADWSITASPAAGPALSPTTVVGSEDASGANTFEVRPNHVYTISEALAVDDGTIAYRQLGIQKLVDGSWVDVDVSQVSAEPGEHATYRFVNDSVPAVVLPLTGGTSTDLFLLIGGIFLLIALSLAAWQQSRRLRGVRGF